MISNLDMKRRKKLSAILKSKKLYIFMKNHSLHTKYEVKLKSLGAIISPFLDKEVHYVLTDTPGFNGKISVTADNLNVLSPCYSVSPATPVSGDDCTTRKTRTRAEAMLERIPVQTQVASSLNPIANAISWNIPVYSVDFFQKWLDKKLAQIQLVNEKGDFKCEGNTRNFEKKYLKLESVLLHQYRPEFEEVNKWPCIDTNTLAGSCPFDRKIFKKSGKKENADKKKEGERMNRTCNKTANEAGYCEICATHYSDLSQHVASSSHLKFTNNEKNYADLDNCIKTRSVEAFLAAHNSSGNNSQSKESNSNELMGRNLRKSVSLHLNNNENSAVTRSLSNAKLLADESLKQPLQVQCNGFTNYHLRKTAPKSDSTLIRSPGYYASKDLLRESRKPYGSCPEGVNPNKDHPQLSPAKEENVHRLRSRKNLFLPSILIGTTAEDGANKARAGISPQTPTSNHFLRSSVSPKSHYGTRSRLPCATATAEDEKKNSLHKGEHGNTSIYFTRSKLSSASPNDESKRNSRSSVSPRDENHTNGRQSKRKPSMVSDEDERREASSPRNVPSYQMNRKVSRNNEYNDTSLQNNADKGQKKRLSYEEKFLEDNREYYKVEMLRTKLRSTEFYCNQEINHTVPPTMKNTVPQTESTKELDEHGQPVVVRFQKMKQRKQSALHLLNLEAENFLFGPPKREDDSEDSSEESDDDDGKQKGDDTDDKKEPPEKKTNEEIKKEKDPNNSLVKQAGRRTKAKKRRTHAEVFIHDNLDYYRFEISGSRLRHQNADGTDVLVKNEPDEKSGTSVPVPSCSSSTSTTVKIKEENVTDEDESQLPLKKRGKKRRKVTNESEKENETEKVQEKEQTEDCPQPVENSCCPDAVPAQSIHFSFESVPVKEPWYKTFQRYDACDEFYIPLSNNYVSKLQKITNNKPAPTKVTSTPNEVAMSPLQRRKIRSRIGRIIVEDKPRKSPRCHASTLAILSSLTNHRRRSRKIHAVETRRSHDNRSSRSEVKVRTSTPAVNSALEYENRLKVALNSLAKEADEHFIDVFANEDCRDRYLEVLKKKDQKVPEPSEPTISDDDTESHCCMQLDEEIFRDQDLLNCFIGSTSETIAEDMATFMDNAQRCSSMETAQDEESLLPRSNDLLTRLCRENDYSCNSSDCGASSTCEFLGFAEDGRTVSRKRKRKRPNMTGWPHNNRRRRNIRFSDVNQSNIETNGDIETEASSSQPLVPETDNENNSEADSECTDDDMPLSQIVSRKRRRTNSHESADDSATNSSQKERISETTNQSSSRISLRRRSTKSGGRASSLPYNRRSSQNQLRNRTKRRRRC